MPACPYVVGGAVLVLSLAAPASAADQHVAARGKAGTEEVTGNCTFTGTTTTDGQMRFAFGGYAVATSATGRLPAETVVTCTIVSPAQGLPGEAPTLRQTVSAANPGPGAAAADLTPAWPVRPIRVCVDGHAVFDPVAPVHVDIREQCRTATM